MRAWPCRLGGHAAAARCYSFAVVYDPPKKPLSPNERLVLGLAAAAFAALIAAEMLSDYRPAKLGIVCLFASFPPLLVLHEFGHAVVARLLGWRVEGIYLGFGRPVTRFILFGLRVEVRRLPVEGFVSVAPGNLVQPQLKSALIYLAGPGVELLLAAAVFTATGSPSLAGPDTSLWTIALQSMAIMAVLGAVMNLIPHTVATQDGAAMSDGLGFLTSFVTPTSVFAERMK
ncbi:MAG: site-2 protease family protein [Pseudomonadota bacterium]